MKNNNLLISMMCLLATCLLSHGQIRTEKDIKKMISNGIVNKKKAIKDTEHEWNRLAMGKEVSLKNQFKNGVSTTELEDSLLARFDNVVINSNFPKCYFLIDGDNIGICKLDGTIVVPPCPGVPRKIKSVGGLRVGDTYSFEDIYQYFVGRIGSKARGVGGCITALLDENTLDPIIPVGRYTYILFTTKGMKSYYYVAKHSEEGLLWGCVDSKGNEMVPCEYSSIKLEGGKFVGDNSVNMWIKMASLKKDIANYNTKLNNAEMIFVEKVGDILSTVGNGIIKLDAAMREYGVYEMIANSNMYGNLNYLSTLSVPSSSGQISGMDGNKDRSSRNYQSMYDNWERRAEKNYNSITVAGTRATNKKTGEKSGSTGGSMSSNTYVQMKKSFREAQRQMRQIREKAAGEGIVINQSKWETASISY